MRNYTLTHLSDDALLHGLAALVARNCTITAALLAHIGEVDARRLYLPAGHPSMHAYCVDGLHLSEHAAYKRIQAARVARQFPELLPAVADGRLHLSAVCLLAAHLTAENVEELVAASAHRRKAEVERWLAERFGLRRAPLFDTQLAPGQVDVTADADELAPGQVHGSSSQPAPSQGGDARSSATTGTDARRGHISSSITSIRWRAAGRPRWNACDYSAGRTIHMRRNAPTARTS